VRQIERFTGNKVSLMVMPGLEPRSLRPTARGGAR